MRLFFLLLLLLSFTACTSFEVENGEGVIVRTTGAPLVSRKDSFIVTHQWLDQNNVLHEVTITRNTDESVDAQVRAMEFAFQAGKASVTPLLPIP